MSDATRPGSWLPAPAALLRGGRRVLFRTPDACGEQQERSSCLADAHLVEELGADRKAFLGWGRNFCLDPCGEEITPESAGDIVSKQVPLEDLDQLRATDDYLVVEDVVRRIVNRKRAPLPRGRCRSCLLPPPAIPGA